MAVLIAALVAALLIHATDRTAWLAAMLGDRFALPAVVAGIVTIVAAANAVAAVAGLWLAREMGPEAGDAARDLLLALALLAAGGGAVWPLKPPRIPNARGGVAGALLGAALLAPGDRTTFVTLALAARGGDALPAAIGATLGGAIVAVGAALGGMRRRRAVPVGAIRIAIGVVLLAAGAIRGLAALALV